MFAAPAANNQDFHVSRPVLRKKRERTVRHRLEERKRGRAGTGEFKGALKSKAVTNRPMPGRTTQFFSARFQFFGKEVCDVRPRFIRQG